MTKLAVSEMQNNIQKELSVISRFNLNGPAVVAASAGTGKTYTITGLVVRLLLGDGIPFPLPIDEIMLMTFTNAATRDMKRKVREKIEDICDLFQKCLHNQDVNTVANPNTFEYELLTKNNGYWLREENIKLAIKLLRNAITSMDKANISTIHSFCGGLLKKYAMDSMYDMGSTLVNEDKEIKQEAVFKVIQKYMYKLSSDEIELLATLTNNDFVKYSRNSIENLTNFLSPYYTDKERNFITIENIPQKIEDIVQQYKKNIEDFKSSIVYSSLQKIVVDLNNYISFFNSGLLKLFSGVMPKSAEEFIPLFITDPNVLSSNLNKRKKNSEEFRIISNLSDEIASFFCLCKGEKVDGKQLVNHLILKEAASIYKSLKENQRIITNDDLLLNLRDALNSDSAQAEFISDEVRKQYPVAIIDEFQDTDPVQFDIVSKLYLSYFTKLRQNSKSLEETMVEQNQFCGFYIIGDEKQSIYRFRGADVDCYLNAVNTIEGLFSSDCEMNRHVFTLTKNFRSTSKFVEASNELFKPELLSAVANNNLVYKNVDSNGLKLDFINTTENNSKLAPVHIISVDGKIEGEYQDYLAKLCANQIVNDLKNGYFVKNNTEGQLSVDETSIKIKPSNITILVRKAAEYAYVEKALKAVGLTSVYCSDKRSIKQTEEFESILNLMKAVDNPQDRGNIRNLLVSSFFTNDIELFEQNLEDAEYEKLINVLSDCKDTWLNNTFFDMYVHFINNYKILTKNEGEISIQEHLLSQRNGMTKITNLQHAAEIAQKYSSNVAAQTDLIPLFENIINNNTLGDDETDNDDSMKLRLSGDENTIKVYTYHSSKGLEYDVVYMPFIGIKTVYTEKGYILRSFEENGNKLFDYSKKEESKKYEDVQSEQEELRLWYVAATRPKYRMYLWIYSGQTDKTSSVTDKIAKTIIQGAKDEQHLVNPELFNISLVTYDPYLAFDSYYIPPKNYSSYGASEFDGEINNDWHITSYSGISKNLNHDKVEFTVDENSTTESLDDQNSTSELGDDFCFQFPKGATPGDFLHKVLEEIDFKQASIDPMTSLEPVIQDLLEVSHLHPNVKKLENVKKISNWIKNIINTPLDSTNLKLVDKGNDECIKEMEFLMKLGNNTDSTAFIDKLFDISIKSGLRDKKQVKDKNIGSLKGLLVGFIDLFFKHKGKFYVADYKSNTLGNELKLYSASNIKKSMAASNYDIQFLIYSVAAYRYLRNIYSENGQFNFKDHFGGVYYLYLRGMNGKSCKYGVYHKELDEDLEKDIIELNNMLGDNNND